MFDFSEDDKNKIVADMCHMIQCKTVSNLDESKIDRREFDKFADLLREAFPTIYSTCEFFKIGKTGLVHKISGKATQDSGASPDSVAQNPSQKHAIVLMAHYDVVPVVEADWAFNPFAGDVVDGSIRGRGTMDTKGTLCACMEAVELSLKKGWRPE